MLRDFIKEGAIYTFANLVTKGVSLLLIPFYTAYFSPADYGVLDLLTVFTAFVNAVLSLQIGQGASRYLADQHLNDDEKRKIGSTAINLVVLTYLAGTLLLFISAGLWTNLLSSETETVSESIFKLSVSTIGLNAVFYQLGVHLRFKRKTKIFAITSFLQAVLTILITYIFVSEYAFGIDAVFYASLVVSPLMIIVQLLFMQKDFSLYIGKKESAMLLKFSVPLIPAAIAYIVLELTDRLFLAEYRDFSEVGIYGIAARFSGVFYLVISGFSMALAPLIYENYENDQTRNKLNKLTKIYFLAGGIAVLILSVFSYQTLVLFTNEKYYGASLVMPLLYTSVFFSGIGMFSVGINLKGKTYITSLVVLFSAALNVVLNFIFIPEYGYVAAGYTTLVSVWLNQVVLFNIAGGFYSFYPVWKVVLNSTLIAVIVLLISAWI
ncbi:MAG: oligosaccharide flippase family protein [Crocinitomicaceae bacterium]|nr:oligosaccharide flippase family protein [Crocinitomicaceae bacterium]